MVDPDGIYIPVDEKYADQRKVYEEIGSDILDNSWYYIGNVGKGITVVYLPMGKLDLGSRIQC